MPPIWILEESLDGGKTWRVSSPWQVYKCKESANKRLETYKGQRWLYRITEYKAIDEDVTMSECPVCRESKIEKDPIESERKEARVAADKDREMMKKWRQYIQNLPPYKRFTFEVFENGELSSLWASADTETEDQARNKLNKYIEDNRLRITIGNLTYSEPRSKHLMASNFLEDKEHLEKAGIPEYKQPPILYGRPH